MKRILLSVVILLATGVPVARAQTLHLAYNDCGSGITNVTDACTSDVGNHEIVASFAVPAGTTAVLGAEARIDIQVDGAGAVPPWWQAFRPGSCRGDAIGVSLTPPARSCADYFNAVGSPRGGFAYDYIPERSPTGPGNAWIRALTVIDSTATPRSFEAAGITPGSDCYLFTIRLSMAKTIGADACPGCEAPACLVFNRLDLVQPVPYPTLSYTAGYGPGDYVTWQGGAVFMGCPASVPARRTTWGAVKSLYR